MRIVIYFALFSAVAGTPTCCWSKYGDASSCGNYHGSGGLCNTNLSKKCTSAADCPATPVPPSPPPTPPGPPGPPSPPPPPPPVPPHPPAPPAPPLPEKSSQELLGWLENWGPDVSWWNAQLPGQCAMGCFKPQPFIAQTAPYSALNYGFVFLTKEPNAAQVGCGTDKPAGPCPTWDGQNIYIAAATKQGSVAVSASTNVDSVSPGILSIADGVRMGKMHPSGPKRVKITLGGWSDYGRFGNAANGIKAANLMAKLVAFTFADGVDMDLEHLTPYSGLDDEYGALIAFITQLRNQLDVVSKNWAKTANARRNALQKQYKSACASWKHCTSYTKRWWLTNIRHLQEVAALGAPHLEISWTTRFNAFLPSDKVPDVWNYLLPDSAKPDKYFRFETDNEGKQFWPQVAHLVDTVNIMAYDEGVIHGVPIKLNFTTILNNFVKYGNITPSKINMGFEPGPQADHGKWEGEAMDESFAHGIAQKHLGGGVAIWAVNPTPKKTNNASKLCANAAKALSQIIKPTYAFGKTPNYTKSDANGLWPASLEEFEPETIVV